MTVISSPFNTKAQVKNEDKLVKNQDVNYQTLGHVTF